MSKPILRHTDLSHNLRNESNDNLFLKRRISSTSQRKCFHHEKDCDLQDVRHSKHHHVLAILLTSHEESPSACHGARRRGRPWRRTDCCLSEPPSGDASTPRRCRKGAGSRGRDCWADWTGPPKILKEHQLRQGTISIEEKIDKRRIYSWYINTAAKIALMLLEP